MNLDNFSHELSCEVLHGSVLKFRTYDLDLLCDFCGSVPEQDIPQPKCGDK